MMETEFNLSDKIPKIKMDFITGMDSCMMLVSDVKEFIRLLKEKLCKELIENKYNSSSWDRISQDTIYETINDLAGEKLNGN